MSFLYPAFLFGLALTAVPVIIHFFNFQRAKKVYFTNVAFLSTVKEITNSRNKLRNILVLLARILFITFLVLAFARPFVPNENAAATTAEGHHVSIYFDNSYSMQNERDNRRLLDISVNHIEELSKVFSGNTLFQLIDNSFEGNLNYFFEKDKLIDKLSEANYSNAGRELEEVFNRQKNALRESGAGDGNHVFWVSDFQRSSVGDLTQLELDTMNSYYLVPMKPNSNTNLYIDSIWLDNPFIKEQENNMVHVKVDNFGDEQVYDRVVKLYVDGKEVSSNTIDIDAGSSAEIEMNFAVTGPGEKKCRISLEDYPVTFDNDYYFVLKVAPKIKVITIGTGKSDFIEDVYSTESFFEVTKYHVNALDFSALESADLIVLEDLPEIDNALSTTLQRVMANGTSLAVFPGAKADPESYASLVQVPLSLTDAGKPGDAQGKNEEMIGVQPPSQQNPFFDGVFEKISPNMSMPKGKPVFKWPSVGTNLLQYRNNTPFLSMVNLAQAKIFIFSTPLDLESTDFPKHAIFVPTMYKIALTSKIRNERLAYSFNETVASISMDSLHRNDIFKLVSGDIEVIPSQRAIGNMLLINIPKNNLDAGNYELVNTNTGQVAGYVAFNYDNSESKLDYYTTDELKKIFEKNPRVQLFEATDEDRFISEFNDKNVASPLWRYALFVALFFLLLETLLIRFWKTA